MPSVVVVGTLDTKGHEYAYLCERLRDHGVDVLVVDAGVGDPLALEPDVGRVEVARAGGGDVANLVAVGDRGAAVAAMGAGAEAVVRALHAEGRLDGIVALGGSGGSSIAAQAMRALPVGVPKLLVSTVASGDTRPYVGAVDVTMMYSVVDIAGLNSVSARIIANAAAAIAAMAAAPAPRLDGKPIVGATMFGVTTPCVTRARERLEELGYEVLVFHATGSGGRSLEALARDGFLAGVLDVTTTELADELVGGVLSAGPHRVEAAGAAGVPQVVSVGALDMVNFGSRETVPAQFDGRNLYVHNPTVTLMRTTKEECAELGHVLGAKLAAAKAATAVFVPLGGVSMIDVPGQPFHDPEADEALVAALKEELAGRVELHELPEDVNDPQFALAMADRLHELIDARPA
ncbi:MAG: Tm-1-like ATP-binding domain-containing protein [Gaiellaceae bacterium]